MPTVIFNCFLKLVIKVSFDSGTFFKTCSGKCDVTTVLCF